MEPPLTLPPFNRFVCPPDGAIQDDGGFLFDPESEYSPRLQPQVEQLAAVERFPCLVLLGEPGCGKSTALRTLAGTKEAGPVLRRDLAAYGSDALLAQRVFDSPEMAAWRAGTGTLTLTLDSFDECLMRIDTLAAFLGEELSRQPVDRLRLRLACRTAVWPAVLDTRLRERFGRDGVGVYELQPLRRRDVSEAATAAGYSAGDFLDAVFGRELVPLANRPITLRFLLQAYGRPSGLPATQAELYRQGCRLLTTELSPTRRAGRRTGELTSGQRYALAGRIATTLMVCRRAAVTATEVGPGADELLAVGELLGGTETGDGLPFPVTEAAAREALDTALFSARGAERLAFAHQSYAEFLAAEYLAGHLSPEQILPLITHQSDAAGRVVPQLAEVAAWLATLQPGLSRDLLARDPAVLLGSDLTTAAPDFRRELVVALLGLAGEHRLVDRNWGLRRRYHRLAHPGLADQLRPVITDRTAPVDLRRTAIDIAEECQLAALGPDLVAVALAPSEPYVVRTEAAHAAARVADADTIGRLRPLALEAGIDDPDDELKGATLRALFPAQLSAGEVFAHLSWPQNDSLGGAYAMFVGQELPARLAPEHLVPALDWLARNPASVRGIGRFEKLAERVLALGWEHLGHPVVRAGYARAVAACLVEHHPIARLAGIATIEDQRRRWLLFDELVPAWVAAGVDPRSIIWAQTPVVRAADADGLFERCVRETVPDRQEWLARLCEAVTRDDLDSVNRMIDGASRCLALARVFGSRLTPIRLDSEEARRMRAEYVAAEQAHREMEDRIRRLERPPLDPPPAVILDRQLAEFETGDRSAWTRLNDTLLLRPDGSSVHDLEVDLTRTPGWADAAAETRRRLVAAAEVYLANEPAHLDDWIDEYALHWDDWAGFRALWLLLRESPSRLDGLPRAAWEQWGPVVIASPFETAVGRLEPHIALARRAYAVVPREVIATLNRVIDRGRQPPGWVTVHDLLRGWLDDRLAGVLFAQLEACGLPASVRQSIFRLLVEQCHPPALARLVAAVEGVDVVPREEATDAAELLVRYAPAAGWPAVWGAAQRDAAFGRGVFLALSHRWDRAAVAPGLAGALSADQMADLYLWLAREFPQENDPPATGVHVITPRESVDEFRDVVLNALCGSGTSAAVTAIERIAAALQDATWLRRAAEAARQTALDNTWLPPAPAHLRRLVEDRSRRLVENGDQLLAVVRESLRRLEAELQGDTPSAPALWNTLAAGNTPKDEESLSDFIALHLRRDLRDRGVVVNREVQIRRGEGAAPGERTDIHVTATCATGDRFPTVSVILEVKGCWNRNRETDLADQLRDRYLSDNQCRHGLYVVGWFVCSQWDAADRNRRRAPTMGLADARVRYEELARQASRDGMVVQALVLNTALR